MIWGSKKKYETVVVLEVSRQFLQLRSKTESCAQKGEKQTGFPSREGTNIFMHSESEMFYVTLWQETEKKKNIYLR